MAPLLRKNVIRSKLKTNFVFIFFLVIFIFILSYIYLNSASKYSTLSIKSHIKYEAKPQNIKQFYAGVNSDDDLIVLYNRVPKSASTTFMGIVYELSATNNFNVMHLNVSKNVHVMSLADQYRFVNNITGWYERHPVVVHGHFAFINFVRLGGSAHHIYVNVIRKPLDRLVSYYYFLRNGDNFRPNLVRKKHADRRTFDECVQAGSQDCRAEALWLQIPFFCGQDADCWRPGNRWALEQAKRNVLEHYFLVGVTEALPDFLQLLEVSLPRIFRGSLELYHKSNRSHLRQTFNKTMPSAKTVAKMQQSRIWQMENEFYQFVLDQFNFVRGKSLNKLISGDGWVDKGQQYFYEKIRPR